MPLIKERRFVADDPWVRLSEDESLLPPEGPVIVPLARWQSERELLEKRNTPLGIALKSDENPEVIADDLDRFALVALEMPMFKDGRAFSYAAVLRERFGFEGEIRAFGHIIRDQLLFLDRCGVNSIEVDERVTQQDLDEAFGELTVFYQPAQDERPDVLSLRDRLAERAKTKRA